MMSTSADKASRDRPGAAGLASHHVLVTGGGSGLGRAMAVRFAHAGARVTINGRTAEKLNAVVDEITGAGGQAQGIVCDIREHDQVEDCIARSEEAFGPLDALVNNAAANFLARSESLSPGAFSAIVRTNLYGSFYATQAVGRRWIERGSEGVVLSIVTTYAETGSAFVLPSAMSKAGVVAMTRSLAVEWGRHGIRLNAIAPGPFPTEGAWSRLVPDAAVESAMRMRIPLRRFGIPEELAELAAFLISPAASYMSGSVITLDGGEMLSAGGQFNDLARHPPEKIDEMFAAMRR